MATDLGNPGKWIFRALVMGAFVLVIWFMLFRAAAVKTGESVGNCLDRNAHGERYLSRLQAVEGYARCVSRSDPPVAARNPRCPWVGLWSAQRSGVEYFVTLRADGSFLAEPGRGTQPGDRSITGAWTHANGKLVWAYDARPVWPPDINPMFDVSARAFKLRELDGNTTEYILIEPEGRSQC